MDLRFKTGEEFQNFFAQLAAAEIQYFEPVEGSGGNSGFDGIACESLP